MKRLLWAGALALGLGGAAMAAVGPARRAGGFAAPGRLAGALGAAQPRAADLLPVLEALRAVDPAGKPVLLVSHSKGGLDVLEMLLKRPELRAKVKGWIAIQAPFAGSPVVDWLQRHPVLRVPLVALLRALGGGLEALAEVETAWRRERLAEQDEAIRRLALELPILAVSSWKSREPGRWDSILKPWRDWMERSGDKNDGLVTLESAQLRHADRVLLEGVDHQVPVTPSLFLPFDRRAFTGRLLRLMLGRIEDRAGKGPPAS